MVKVTLTFDYPSKEKFLKSDIWRHISKLIDHFMCISFTIDETEDIG